MLNLYSSDWDLLLSHCWDVHNTTQFGSIRFSIYLLNKHTLHTLIPSLDSPIVSSAKFGVVSVIVGRPLVH